MYLGQIPCEISMKSAELEDYKVFMFCPLPDTACVCVTPLFRGAAAAHVPALAQNDFLGEKK